MPMLMRRAGFVAALAATLIACGAAGDDAESRNIDPLAELLGWDVNQSPAEQRAQQLAVEEAVQTCMRAEGFEYTPVDYDAQFGGDEEDAELFNDPEAFGEKYGYGVVRNYEQYEEPYLVGGEDASFGPVFEDPNQEYLDSLSESEREAYYTVLNGEQLFEEPAIDENGNEVFEAPPIEEQGCYGQAQLEVFGEDRFQIDPEVEQRLNDFYGTLQDDPEIETAEQDWLDCMKNEQPDALESDVSGFSVTAPEHMYQLFDFKKSEAMGMNIVDYSQDDQGGSSYGSDGEQRPIPDDELEALRALELSVWKIDFQCQKDADIPGIQRRIQQRLVDELQAEFPELGNSDS